MVFGLPVSELMLWKRNMKSRKSCFCLFFEFDLFCYSSFNCCMYLFCFLFLSSFSNFFFRMNEWIHFCSKLIGAHIGLQY
ncbi:hypothetical protein RchiOBHm_Chr7g0180881 [Rosa chinensis]|uniref:Uncharacterized protein n=1 Tax=Rosa chinensis TaxID=74649 RepID=A0A2P6P2H8_ROSCH|nr:hypothetical protein RchiOBHm_Chr7g0180881 [Rosa chinensis]